MVVGALVVVTEVDDVVVVTELAVVVVTAAGPLEVTRMT